jgi:hypothetical protein
VSVKGETLVVDFQERFKELILDKRKLIETFFVVETKQRQIVPFTYNAIQDAVDREQTGHDIWVKPSQVGFSTERIANRLADTLTTPGTNTVLIAFEDFVTQRLLSKVSFFYNHLSNLNIPGFPEIYNDSDFLKTFRFYSNGRLMGVSSIYIASARSKTAGRSEPIHHLLLDEHAFYVPEATERVIAPAMARLVDDGTADSFSTPNGEENDFHDWYVDAKQGNSIFAPHCFTWFMLPEYAISLGDKRILEIPDSDKPTFNLNSEEEALMAIHELTFDQIRWRRWKSKVMDSLRSRGEIRTLFKQEYPEDDTSCFFSTGDMYFDESLIEKKVAECYDAPVVEDGLHVWYQPKPGTQYFVAIDPGQARVSQTALTVLSFEHDADGIFVRYHARDAGLYEPETTAAKAQRYSRKYNNAMIGWEANSHGLSITVLLKNQRNIYLRKDIVSGVEILVPGWYTSGGIRGTKDYMLSQVISYLPRMDCHDIEFFRQCRNHRKVMGRMEIVGFTDIFMSTAIGICCMSPNKPRRGYAGRSGWKW